MSPTPTERTPTPDPPREELARLEERLANYLASYPAHERDLGPDNTVFGDHIPSDGAEIGEVPKPIQRLAHDLLTNGYARAILAPRPQLEEAAQILWHRFAPDSHVEWDDDPHKAEYRAAAEAILSTLPHADAPKLSNDGRPVMPEGCAEAADMRPALQVARKDAPSPVAAGPSKEATMGGVKLTDDHEYTDLEWAEILERMAGVYPGDPTGALMREACALRGVPYDPPEVTITVFDDDGRVIDDADRAALRGAGDV